MAFSYLLSEIKAELLRNKDVLKWKIYSVKSLSIPENVDNKSSA